VEAFSSTSAGQQVLKMSFKLLRGSVLVLLVLCTSAFSPALCAGSTAQRSAPLRGRLARLLHPFEVLEERVKHAFGEAQQQQREPKPTAHLKHTQSLVIDTEIELEDYQAPSLPRALKQVPTFTQEPVAAPTAGSYGSQGSYGAYGDQDEGSYGESKSDAGYSGPSRRLLVEVDGGNSGYGDDSKSGYGDESGYGSYGTSVGQYGSRHLMEYVNGNESYGTRRLLMEGEGGGYGYDDYGYDG